jgi:hypothetical protein
MLSESDFTEEELNEPGFREFLARAMKLERHIANALIIRDDDAAVAYLVAAGCGSEYTCGMLISRARGGTGDLIDLAS